jgi:hypothetical protein
MERFRGGNPLEQINAFFEVIADSIIVIVRTGATVVSVKNKLHEFTGVYKSGSEHVKHFGCIRAQ